MAAAADQVKLAETGHAFISSDLDAALYLSRLGSDVEPKAAVETVLAMFMLREFDGRHLKSDEAFQFQLVRRVRALSDVSVASYHEPRTGRTKKVYRDLRPRATRTLAGRLLDALGGAALYIARRERQRIEEQAAAKQALGKALSELK